ncbi:MAG: hypothetical protein COB17_07695 [Sulfurimonas sp.]|nr:MAG: hypothetical protein COB17_07695 [Sulfurimonas sp.]
MVNKKIIATIIATITASLCCVTPVLAVLAGTSSLSTSFSWMEPYHNYLVGLTVLVLLYAWYDKLKAQSNDINCACDDNGASGFFSSKNFLAMVTVFSIIMLSFPQWANYYFEGVPTANSCSSGGALPCSATATQERDNTLPVLQYMSNERANPTACNQKACTGTGREELDDLLTNARKEVVEMSPAVLKKMFDNSEEVILLDVRGFSTKKKYDIYTDDESYAIPRCNLEFKVLNEFPDKDITIVVYSRLGARSLLAAQSMKHLGFKNVYNLTAGVMGWARAGYPFSDGDEGKVIKTEDEV